MQRKFTTSVEYIIYYTGRVKHHMPLTLKLSWAEFCTHICSPANIEKLIETIKLDK